MAQRRSLVSPSHPQIHIKRQCELLGIHRSGIYYQPAQATAENLWLMNEIDRVYTRWPFYGSRRITAHLNRTHERSLNRKRIQRLMQDMGIAGIGPGPNTSTPHPHHKIYPYLLRDVVIRCPDHVWSTDITYIPMQRGYMYLVAVIDWYSRYVLSWELSNTQDTLFCLDALETALSQGHPEIFNTDQGSQFTSKSFTSRLLKDEIQISMDGRGRALDNIFVERLWRSVKYENVYLNDYQSVKDLRLGLNDYFTFYNHERLHQSLDYRTPFEVHFSRP